MRIIFLLGLLIFTLNVSAKSLEDYLLPFPKQVKVNPGQFERKSGFCCLPSSSLQKQALLVNYQLSKTNIDATLLVLPITDFYPLITFEDTILNEQGYKIMIEPDMITVKASSEVGYYYAMLTLEQIGNYANERGFWPCVEIYDEPDFTRRGVMIDISRDKVPTTETLEALINQLSRLKINEIQLYTEHTFAYSKHKVVWENASPMTADQIKKLDQYCQEYFIDLVPNQNSFGHMNRWLQHKQYTQLSELERPGKTIWGMRSKNTLSPVEKGSLKLMQELYAELLPNFSSQYFNIGCDETVELGVGKSKELCQKIGKGQVYLNYLKALKEEVDKYDRTSQFWGDIILNHPELIDSLPKSMVALIWGYEADYPFDANCNKFKKAGLDYYVCPGSSSWNAIIGRNQNAFANIKSAAINGKKHDAFGFLLTNWGDNGHWQPLSVSYPSFLYGAATSWDVANNKNLNIAAMTSRYFFNDSTNITGDVVVNLGNAYLMTDVLTDNSNIFFQLLKRNSNSSHTDMWLKQAKASKLKATQQYIQNQIKRLNESGVSSYDATIDTLEIKQAAELAMHACKVGIAKSQTKDGNFKSIPETKKEELIVELQGLIENHKKLWVIRNRPGGLNDSAKKLEKILKTYE